MSQPLPAVYLARHGETAWTVSGQHTGLTDIPLTDRGERNARRLGERLKGMTFARVFTSPLQRARRTCELAGFGGRAEADPDLRESNYGEYECKTSAEIHKVRPDWQIFRDGCPGGETSPPSAPAQTAWSRGFGRWTATSCYFPAAISCASSPPAGWGWMSPTADFSFSARPR